MLRRETAAHSPPHVSACWFGFPDHDPPAITLGAEFSDFCDNKNFGSGISMRVSGRAFSRWSGNTATATELIPPSPVISILDIKDAVSVLQVRLSYAVLIPDYLIKIE